MTYRPDIDGLRAVAVISVILFHLNSSWLPGGFLGVDIFFVISGYLIGGILFRELSTNTFSLKNFYLRRMRRILPAFFAVVIPVLLLSRFLVLPDTWEMMKLERGALSASFWVNNLFSSFYGANYFGTNVKSDQLTHLWSLSVEEQFYFLYPLMLWLLMLISQRLFPQIKRQWRIVVILLICLMMLCCSSVFIDFRYHGTKGDVYFLSLPRFGELLVGAILAIYSQSISMNMRTLAQSRVFQVIEVASTIVLLLCMVLPFPNEMPLFPGFLALVPCVATAFIIYCGSRHKGFIYHFLSLRPVNFVGRISYSLYLWHLPVLASTYYVTDGNVTIIGHFISIILIIILSLLSYYCVEQPFRHKQWSFVKTMMISYVLPTICVVALYNFRPFSEEMKPYTTCGSLRQINYLADYVGDSTQKATVLIAGDSYTQHLYEFFDVLGKHEGWKARISYVPGVPYIGDEPTSSYMSEESEDYNLAQKRNELINKELPLYDHIVLSMRWTSRGANREFMQAFYTAIKRFEKQNKKVTLVFSEANTPEHYGKLNFYKIVGVPFLATDEKISAARFLPLDSKSQEFSTLRYVKTHFPKVDCIVLHQYYSDSPFVDGKCIMLNKDHLNAYGANILARRFIADGKRLIPSIQPRK